MTRESPSLLDEPTERDTRLAELLDRLLHSDRDHAAADVQRFADQFPDLADELRELWATAQLTEQLAISVTLDGEGQPLHPAGHPTGESATVALPRQFGDYLLLEELGRGGMGVVYKARQISLDRMVALKMILRGDLASNVDLARFRAEAEAAAQLQHPHIVQVFEVGDISGQPYFSMQLVEGTTLSRQLLNGPLPPREAARLLLPVCRAIGEAHRQGVWHRDLKPSNILIDQRGESFVSDFGLAKRVNSDDSGDVNSRLSLTQTGAILGTPGYMAPEQAAGRRGVVSASTDVYALGAILYAMLTGRPPFQAASALDTVMQVLEQEPIPPRLVFPQADPDLQMIALKCLQKPADLRYASADELADDLERFLANEPISARSSRFSQVITRAFRETHHAAVLENWGLLWMWHSLVVLSLCLVTNWMQLQQVVSRWPYVSLWSVGVGTWAAIFWELRRRSGPITFVERQIAHLWGGSTLASTLLFALEWQLELRALTLSPVLPLIAGSVFLAKAGILSGRFYVQATLLYATAFVMAALRNTPYDYGLTIFGLVIAWSFFAPGLKYFRQRQAGLALEASGERPTVPR